MALIHDIAEISIRVLSSFSKIDNAPLVTLEKLEMYLDKMGSIENWLSKPKAHDEYFLLLDSYFSKQNFTRQSFDLVMAQLSSLNEKAPQLTKKLWERPAQKEFTFKVESSPSGKNLNLSLWRIFRSRWLNTLESDSAGIDEYKAQQIAMKHEELMLDFSTKSKYLSSKREQLKFKGDFFFNLKKDKDLKKLASYLILTELVKPKKTLLLKLDEADIILDFFSELRSDADLIAPSFLKKNKSDFILWKIKSLIPNPTFLVKDRKMFPHLKLKSSQDREFIAGTASNAIFSTREIRGLHGIFAGICYQDCLAGNLNTLEYCSARRWAIGGLNESKTFSFERNGRYQGFIRLVHVSNQINEPFFSTDICVPIFNSRVNFKKRTLSLFQAWFVNFSDYFNDFFPLIISESRLGDLAQIKQTVFNSEPYLNGISLQRSEEYKISDKNISEYLRIIPPGIADLKYGQSFITDALLIDSGKVRKLNKNFGEKE